MKKNIVLIVGGLLTASRLFFPVLQCAYRTAEQCHYGPVIFFSFKPEAGYYIHDYRTCTQALALAILTAVLYFVFLKK